MTSDPGQLESSIRHGLEETDAELLVLFGSHAKGRASRRSDVDLALMGPDWVDLDRWRGVLAPLFGTGRLDLVDLRHAPPLLAYEVARTGRPLFERRPGTFRTFQSLAARRYADTTKLRTAQRRAIQVFLAQRGL